MIEDLMPTQRRLAEYMSALSQAAYYAGWMEGLEIALWEVLQGTRREYGRLTISDAQRQELQELSRAAGGWITWDEQHERSFVPIDEWIGTVGKRTADRESSDKKSPIVSRASPRSSARVAACLRYRRVIAPED